MLLFLDEILKSLLLENSGKKNKVCSTVHQTRFFPYSTVCVKLMRKTGPKQVFQHVRWGSVCDTSVGKHTVVAVLLQN